MAIVCEQHPWRFAGVQPPCSKQRKAFASSKHTNNCPHFASPSRFTTRRHKTTTLLLSKLKLRSLDNGIVRLTIFNNARDIPHAGSHCRQQPQWSGNLAADGRAPG